MFVGLKKLHEWKDDDDFPTVFGECMMRNTVALFLMSFLFVAMLSACGSVRFNEKSDSPETASQKNDNRPCAKTNPPSCGNDSSANEELDCDAYMQSFADSCFEVTVMDENGALRNDVDADGNDLGPVDQGWAADYCTCFAQRAFQEFGCAAVYADEELDDAAWQAKYMVIGDACAEAVQFVEQDDEEVEAVDGDVVEENVEVPADATASY